MIHPKMQYKRYRTCDKNLQLAPAQARSESAPIHVIFVTLLHQITRKHVHFRCVIYVAAVCLQAKIMVERESRRVRRVHASHSRQELWPEIDMFMFRRTIKSSSSGPVALGCKVARRLALLRGGP